MFCWSHASLICRCCATARAYMAALHVCLFRLRVSEYVKLKEGDKRADQVTRRSRWRVAGRFYWTQRSHSRASVVRWCQSYILTALQLDVRPSIPAIRYTLRLGANIKHDCSTTTRCLYISVWNSSALPEHFWSAVTAMRPLGLTAYFMSCKRVSQLLSLPEWLTDRMRPLVLLLPGGNSQCLGGRYMRRLRSSLIFDLCCCRIHTTCGSNELIFENNGCFIKDKRSSGLPVTLNFVGSSLKFLVLFARWRKKCHEAFVEDLFLFFIIWRLFWILNSCNMSSLEHTRCVTETSISTETNRPLLNVLQEAQKRRHFWH